MGLVENELAFGFSSSVLISSDDSSIKEGLFCVLITSWNSGLENILSAASITSLVFLSLSFNTPANVLLFLIYVAKAISKEFFVCVNLLICSVLSIDLYPSFSEFNLSISCRKLLILVLYSDCIASILEVYSALFVSNCIFVFPALLILEFVKSLIKCSVIYSDDFLHYKLDFYLLLHLLKS